jgi:hypothetical protein
MTSDIPPDWRKVGKPSFTSIITPTPYAEGKTFESMRSGEMDEKYLPNFNGGERFGKAAHLTTAADIHIGEIAVPQRGV